jgi:hypothetical protein
MTMNCVIGSKEMWMRGWWPVLLFVLLGGWFFGCGCNGGNPGTNNPPADSDLDGAVDGADGQPVDSTVDADGELPDGGTHYEYCKETFFQLPPTTDDHVHGPMLGGNYVTYARYLNYPESETQYDLYLFDLESCTEYLICDVERSQMPGSIYNSQVFWNDSRFLYDSQDPDYHRVELYLFDIPTWTETRLTDSIEMKISPLVHGDYMVFLDNTNAPDAYFGLTLMNLVTSEQKTLATWEAATEEYSISDRYVVWAARSFDATSYGKNVFYYDLLTEETHHLEATRPFNVTMVVEDKGKILWVKESSELIYSMMVHDIATGSDTALTDGTYDAIGPSIKGHLATWITYEYSGGSFAWDPSERDICLFDMETGVSRRVTDHSTYWGATEPDPPWLVIGEGHGTYTASIFVLNLLKGGYIDTSGHVIAE